MTPTLERELALWSEGYETVAGLDEVGRGPLAGPVVASAVVFRPGQSPLDDLRDSKQLVSAERERLSLEIRERALAWSLGAASVREIDRLNIRKATALAMRRAIGNLATPPDYLLLDGTDLPELGHEHESVVRGDSLSQSIAAASVIAKVLRDRLMVLLDRRYPAFGWARNKGYCTAEHLAAVDELGPTPHHRYSFSPVSQINLF